MRPIARGWPLCLLAVLALFAACANGPAGPRDSHAEPADALYHALQGPDRQVLRISGLDTHDGKHVLMVYQETSPGQGATVLAQSMEVLARQVKDSPEFDGAGVIVYSAESGVLGRALAFRQDIDAWLEGRMPPGEFWSRAILK